MSAKIVIKDADKQTITYFTSYMSTLYKIGTPDSWFDYTMEVQ